MTEDSACQWRGRDPLAWLISPVSIDRFIDEYWEQRALVVERESGFYSELLTFGDVNDFMSRNDIRYPYLRLVKNGRELPLVDYADDFVYGSNVFPGLLDNDKVFHHYAEGATLSFQIFQKCMDRLSRFCNALEARLRFQTQVNIFVTPPNSKGFTAHYDDHSFFILQISGSKHWKIYGNPVELPLQEFRLETKTPDLGPPQRELTLNAGDLLYLPKGYYHEAYTSDATSIHITLGIFPFTWAQIFERLTNEVKHDVAFRRSPAEYLRNGAIGDEVRHEFNALLEKVGAYDVAQLFEALFAEAASKQIVDGKDRLRDLTAIGELSATTRIERRNVLCRLIVRDRDLKLAFYDKSVAFPIVAKEAIDFILNSDAFSAEQIPGHLDAASKLVIVRKLIKEGLLSLPDVTSP